MYSRETVDTALQLYAEGLTDRRVAELCGVSIAAVRHWRTGRRRTPQAARTRLDRTEYCPFCGTGLLDGESYSYLLGLYLGDGHIVSARRGVYSLSIFCANTYPAQMDLCESAMRKIFPVSVFRVARAGCVEVKSTSKHWPCLFPQHGAGMKHSRRIELASWQRDLVVRHPEPLVRGLFHSDGCRFTNPVRRKVAGEWKHYSYPRYMFSNTSADIHAILGDALDRLGIAWRLRWQGHADLRHQPTGTLSVARRDAVSRMDDVVGPKG